MSGIRCWPRFLDSCVLAHHARSREVLHSAYLVVEGGLHTGAYWTSHFNKIQHC